MINSPKNLKGDCQDAFMSSMSNVTPRTAPTTPPPPPGATAAELDARIAELEALAGQILARRDDLQRARALLGARR